MHGAGKAVRFFMGSNVRKVLELDICPVMVVPERAVYRNPTKVIFATDFDEAHMEVLRSLRDRKSVVKGKGVSVRFGPGGRRTIKKKQNKELTNEAQITDK